MLPLSFSQIRYVFIVLAVILFAIGMSDCNRNKTNKSEISKKATTATQPKPMPLKKQTIVLTKTETLTLNKPNPDKNTESVNEKTEIKNNTVLPKQEPTENKIAKTEKPLPAHFRIYSNLKKILKSLKTGQTATKEELIATNAVPDDALKVVKSIRKISNDELEVTWKSVWIMERISDVKLNDDLVKIKFNNNLVYTSGNAIGIEYNDKVYNNLVIKGDRAYIPEVKEYSWRIGP